MRNSIFTDDVKKCAIRSQLKLELIDNHGLDSKIPIICCSFLSVRECMNNNLKSECDESKSHSIHYINNLINKFVSSVSVCFVYSNLTCLFATFQAGDLGKMFCMEYKTQETCSKKLHPDTFEELQEIDTYDYKTAVSKKKFSSFLRLMKHLIEQPIM